MDLERFHELGPELEIAINYSVGYGWYGRASVFAYRGNRQDDREAAVGTVHAEYDLEMDGADDTDNFAALVEGLYQRLKDKMYGAT